MGRKLNIALGVLLPCSAALAQTTTTTMASAPTSARSEVVERVGGRRPGQVMERLPQVLSELDLTAEQREKLKAIREENRKRLAELRESKEADRPGKVREFLQETRAEVEAVLTPEQRGKFRELMAEERGQRPAAGAAARRPATRPAAKADDESMMMAGESMAEPGKGKTTKPSGEKSMDGAAMNSMEMAGEGGRAKAGKKGEKPAPAVVVAGTPGGVAVGQAAPDLRLKQLNGAVVQLSALKGKVVVLVFGSYSTPAFRDKAAGLEKLAKESAGKANFYVVYTREAHPAGGWEVQRNRQEDVHVEQPTDEAGRRAMAQKAKAALKLTYPVIVLDTMEDEAARAFDALPNGVVVIGKDGTVAARQKWLEPMALERIVNETVGKKAAATLPTSAPARE